MSDQNDSKAKSKERYSQFAQGYVTSQTHAKGWDLDRLVEIAQPQPDWTVLDVATGGGHTALKFAPYVSRVVASDLTPAMLQAAETFIAGKNVTNIDFRIADAEDLPFDSGSFDLVTCRIAPHHFPDCARFVRECARVLKTGGLLLVQDHVLPDDARAARHVDGFEKLRDPSHNRAFSEVEWIDMFQAAGLVVEQAEQLMKRHDFMPWAERQGCTPEVIEQLVGMMHDAPPAAAAWMEIENPGTPTATFVNHHIIIAGRKR